MLRTKCDTEYDPKPVPFTSHLTTDFLKFHFNIILPHIGFSSQFLYTLFISMSEISAQPSAVVHIAILTVINQ